MQTCPLNGAAEVWHCRALLLPNFTVNLTCHHDHYGSEAKNVQ